MKEETALRELRALYRVSQAINASLDLAEVVERILSILAEELGMQRGTLALVDPETGELAIEVAHGLTAAEKRRGRYQVGEGITGRALETGEPMVIPNIGAEPLFLNRTGARRDIDRSQVAFLCVPVKTGNETVGVLSADRVSQPEQDLEEDLRLLTIVAGVVAQAVRMQQMVRREKAALADENCYLRRALAGAYRIENLIGTSAPMRAVSEQIAVVAKGRSSVLITGEVGTGKEFVAKAIHLNSGRAEKPFLPLSCASLPEEALARELFGEEPEASGEGRAPEPGLFEMGAGGTVFLDAVSEMPSGLQTKLLRALQEQQFRRVGGRETLNLDARVIAATERDLAEDAREGRFREELYYRLNSVPIHLPPLRGRKEDIPLLAEHFLQRFRDEHGKEVRGFEAETAALLARYDWPGNVRELEDVVHRTAFAARSDAIQPSDLPPEFTDGSLQDPGDAEALERVVARVVEHLLDAPPPGAGVYRAVIDRVERVLVERAVERARGVRVRAARLLGINRNTLYAKVERAGRS